MPLKPLEITKKKKKVKGPKCPLDIAIFFCLFNGKNIFLMYSNK
jgi:hypothetical protein